MGLKEKCEEARTEDLQLVKACGVDKSINLYNLSGRQIGSMYFFLNPLTSRNL